ncbi:MAG: response regulator transcription factor [Saprospiraceae bacterium]|nr:response regulator transcription factor [Saprospiraceae bacterium]
MNESTQGTIYIVHDYFLINEGLQKSLRPLTENFQLTLKIPYSFQELPRRAILICGPDSLLNYTYRGELHPVLKEKKCKVILLTDENSKPDPNHLMEIHIKAVVHSNVETKELQSIIRLVNEGKTYVSPEFYKTKEPRLVAIKTDLKHLSNVTDRELQVLRCITNEMTNKEIAKALFISPRTVETHRRNLIQKLKVKSSVGLVKKYLQSPGM